MTSHCFAHHMVTRLLRTLLLSGVLLQSALLAVGQAQITTDGSLGRGGVLAGPNYRIGANLGQTRGSNLFHSFGKFNVWTGESATFSGPNTIANIVGRVTGGQQSVIDGLLRSEIAGANLFLLNPSGVLFGPNASLDVSGSFHVSTADFLRFADGAKFFAHLSDSSVLSVAPPVAFGFLSPNPAAISIQGSSLQVPAGETLSVIGGNIEVVGNPSLTSFGIPTLGAHGGRVNIASVASAGEVTPSPPDQPPSLNMSTFARLGEVRLADSALIDASGNAGGTVVIRGGRLMVDGSSVVVDTQGDARGAVTGVDIDVAESVAVTNGGAMMTNSLGAGRAGDLRLTAGSVHMTEGSFIGSTAFASGDGGNVALNVGKLTLDRAAALGTGTFGAGRAGTTTVTATDSVAILQSFLFSTAEFDSSGDAGRVVVSAPVLVVDDARISADTGGTGRGGDIEVSVGKLTLTNGAQISSTTRGPGRGGTVMVTATEALTLAGRDTEGFQSGLFSNTVGTGAAGAVVVDAGRLTLRPGGTISSSTGGAGAGGAVSVRGGILEMDEGDITASSARGSTGDAGTVSVLGRQLTLTGGAQISSGTFGSGRGGTVTVTATEALTLAGRDTEGFPSGLFSATEGTGAAGAVVVDASRLMLRPGGTISSSTLGAGAGGPVSVRVGTLEMDGGQIVAQSESTGNAGTVSVLGQQLTLTGGAQISSSTLGSGRGGTVTVTATDSVVISSRDSDGVRTGLFSRTAGSGDAGKVMLSAPTVQMEEGGLIQASTTGEGRGGDSTLHVNTLTVTGGSLIDSSTSGAGRGGTVTISATDVVSLSGQNSGLSTRATGSGLGGDIDLRARQVQLTEGAVISAESSGAGNAGGLRITAHDTFRSERSAVTTEAETADGGNITLTAGSLVHLLDSQITATVKSGVGKGGNITIDPPFVILDRSQIRADAFGGPGGNVRIAAEVFLASPDSVVSASSTLGVAGTVDIRAPITNLSGVLAPLPAAFVSAAALLPARCAVRLSEGKASSLVVGGRDGLPFDPGGLLPSPLTLDERLMSVPTVTEEPRRQKPTASFALLADEDKVFPRMRGWDWQGSARAALDWRCSK